MASSTVAGSSSSSDDKENFSCIIAVSDGCFRKYDWYAFDVSDDPNHNQPRPSALDFTLQPPLSRFYCKLPSHLLPFHEDDDYASVILKPIATRDLDTGTGWAVLGKHLTTTLYRICGDGRSSVNSGYYLGNSVERIELITTCAGGHSGEWKSVAKMEECQQLSVILPLVSSILVQ